MDWAPTSATAAGLAAAPRSGARWGLLAIPGLLFLVVFFVWPVAGMAVRSLTDPTVGIENFLRFFQSPVAATSLVTTLRRP